MSFVSFCRPPVSQVQELKNKVRTVGREIGGGNEVLQEMNALVSVELLFGRERQLRWKAPLINLPSNANMSSMTKQDTLLFLKRASSCKSPRITGKKKQTAPGSIRAPLGG